MEQYEILANAIIIQATRDYRKALRILRRGFHPASEKAIQAEMVKSDCERFFCGKWIKTLTDLDGRTLMKKIRENI